MNSADLSHHLKDFKSHTNKLDIIRSESFTETYPELADIGGPMKILGVYPIANQEVRIQPFFRSIENNILNQIDEFLFIDENSQDKSLEVLNLELKNLPNKYTIKSLSESNSRADTFNTAIEYALKNEFEYVFIFNEGWEDNIQEAIKIIKDQNYTNFDLITSF